MWKTLCLMAFVLSFELQAKTCNIADVEGLLLSLKETSQELELKEASKNYINHWMTKGQRGPRPEVGITIEGDKSDLKENEISAEVLFSLDDYRKYSTLKESIELEGQLKSLSFLRSFQERVSIGGRALFKSSQNALYLKRLSSILSVLESSLTRYEKRPLRSRDEDLAITSMRLMRRSLLLKKSVLEEELLSDKTLLSRWGLSECELSLEVMEKIIADIGKKNEEWKGPSLDEKELGLQKGLALLQDEYERKGRFSNVKIGPTIAREKAGGVAGTRIGVSLSFDFPSLGGLPENEYQVSSRLYQEKVAEVELRAKETERQILQGRLARLKTLLSDLGKNNNEEEMGKLKKSFDDGLISPLVYLESYRSYVDSLETLISARNQMFEDYLKLRGAYEKNNSL